jgi:hypothetical protein
VDAINNAAIVDDVRNIDSTSKWDVVGNVFKLGMLPKLRPATAWSLTTRFMVILKKPHHGLSTRDPQWSPSGGCRNLVCLDVVGFDAFCQMALMSCVRLS